MMRHPWVKKYREALLKQGYSKHKATRMAKKWAKAMREFICGDHIC
jgi:hypothetical protein